MSTPQDFRKLVTLLESIQEATGGKCLVLNVTLSRDICQINSKKIISTGSLLDTAKRVAKQNYNEMAAENPDYAEEFGSLIKADDDIYSVGAGEEGAIYLVSDNSPWFDKLKDLPEHKAYINDLDQFVDYVNDNGDFNEIPFLDKNNQPPAMIATDDEVQFNRTKDLGPVTGQPTFKKPKAVWE